MAHQLHVNTTNLNSMLLTGDDKPVFVLVDIREDGSVAKQMLVRAVKFTSGESGVSIPERVNGAHAWLTLHGPVEYLDAHKVWRKTT